MVQIIACVASSFSTDWNTAVPLLTLPGHTGLADPPQVQDNQPESSLRALNDEAILDVPLHVKCQVVRAGKTPVAVTAFEWLRSGVLPEVSGELITSCKAPLTSLPGTPVGLLTCVRALVCFKMGAFGVHLPASIELTPVHPSPAVWRCLSAGQPRPLHTPSPYFTRRVQHSLYPTPHLRHRALLPQLGRGWRCAADG